jgi:hypothetical protein
MKKLLFIISLAALALANSQSANLPEKLRVLSINLENTLIQAPGVPGGEIAQELRTLLEKSDPDVICLQGVLDWETGERICKLKPGFQVVTCSGFQSQNEGTPTPQIAILARDRAAISWVEEVSDASGFAYALFQAGPRKLGIFSLQVTQPVTGPSTPVTERVLAELAKLKKFQQNRPEAFLIAGAPLTRSSTLIDAGLQNISAEAAGGGSGLSIRSEFWIAQGGFIARPRAVVLKGLRAPAIISDFDAGSSFATKFAYQTPLLFAGETLASVQPPAPAVAPAQPRSLAWPIAIGAGFLVLFSLLLLRRRAPSANMQLVPLNGPQPLVPGTPEHEQIRSGLLEWFKTLFVQRLVAQRHQLLSNEAEATRRTLVIEEKLSTLQNTLQSRISAYETRIERLEHELTAAAVENRDLIRSQIDLLKEKVAKAKEEHAFRRN